MQLSLDKTDSIDWKPLNVDLEKDDED